MQTLKSFLLGVSVLSLSGCIAPASTSETQAVAIDPMMASHAPGYWLGEVMGHSDFLQIENSGSFASSYCGMAGKITEINPNSNCPNGLVSCGFGQATVYVSNENPGCLTQGSRAFAYTTSATTLSLSFGNTILHYGRTDPSVLYPSPSPSPSPTPLASPGAANCVPVNSAQIPVMGTNNKYVTGQSLVAGQIPSGQSEGQLVISGASLGGQFHGQSVDGTLMINIVPTGTLATDGTTSADVTGFVTLSASVRQDIMAQFAATTGQSTCISGIGISGSIYQNTFYNTHVYLYMNGTQQGYALYF